MSCMMKIMTLIEIKLTVNVRKTTQYSRHRNEGKRFYNSRHVVVIRDD